jgi:stringent starvation protein B
MAEATSQKPYLLRALYEWCVDNGFTPYVAVMVDANTRVPMEFVRKGEIVLNVGPLASNNLRMGNDYIEFSARFGGVSRDIVLPVNAVIAIYARENGQGMTFEAEPSAAREIPPPGQLMPGVERIEPRAPEIGIAPLQAVPRSESSAAGDDGDEPPRPPAGPVPGRPTLRRIK